MSLEEIIQDAVDKAVQLGLDARKDKYIKLRASHAKALQALEYAKSFIDGYGQARLKENLGRDGMDAVLREIAKIIEGKDTEPKLCICNEEITKENAHLHKNCGK